MDEYEEVPVDKDSTVSKGKGPISPNIQLYFGLSLLVLTPLEVLTYLYAFKFVGLWPTLFWTFACVFIAWKLFDHAANLNLTLLMKMFSGQKAVEVDLYNQYSALIVLLGSALIFVPGFISDFIGFVTVIGPVRRFLTKCFLKKVSSSHDKEKVG